MSANSGSLMRSVSWLGTETDCETRTSTMSS